jgi:hypothetical protein
MNWGRGVMLSVAVDNHGHANTDLYSGIGQSVPRLSYALVERFTWHFSPQKAVGPNRVGET